MLSEEVSRPRSGRLDRGRPLLALLCVAQFVDVLDVNAVVVALPAIGRTFALPVAELQWVVTAYVLVFAGFLLLAGRLADLLGRRRLFMAGLLIFTLASLGCGLASGPLTLFGARAVQGLGAALTAPAALAIITTSFAEGAQRHAALAVWTGVAAGGGAAGLVVGGLVTDALGWQWVFFVNVPVGLTALALSPVLVPESRPEHASRQLDVAGALSVTAGLALLVFAFSHAERAGFGAAIVWMALAAALAFLALFVLVELHVRAPLVPLRIFRARELVGATTVAAVLTASTSSAGVLSTLYLQDVRGYAASVAGLAALPLSLAVIAGSAAAPRSMRRRGARATVSAGLAGVALAALVASRIEAGAGLGYVLAAAALAGLGLGAASVAATAVGSSSVPEDDRGLASGLLTTAAQIGTALGLAVFLSLASTRAASLADGPPGAEALVSGYRTAYIAAGLLAAAGLLVAWRLLPRASAGQRVGPLPATTCAPRRSQARP
jgi:EmrB/QacA subfamily drug resistance transporter